MVLCRSTLKIFIKKLYRELGSGGKEISRK